MENRSGSADGACHDLLEMDGIDRVDDYSARMTRLAGRDPPMAIPLPRPVHTGTPFPESHRRFGSKSP